MGGGSPTRPSPLHRTKPIDRLLSFLEDLLVCEDDLLGASAAGKGRLVLVLFHLGQLEHHCPASVVFAAALGRCDLFKEPQEVMELVGAETANALGLFGQEGFGPAVCCVCACQDAEVDGCVLRNYLKTVSRHNLRYQMSAHASCINAR